jgi:hypothetical protein
MLSLSCLRPVKNTGRAARIILLTVIQMVLIRWEYIFVHFICFDRLGFNHTPSNSSLKPGIDVQSESLIE